MNRQPWPTAFATGRACRVRDHRRRWFVTARRCNFSAFNGYRREPSAYSEVWCSACGRRWRTKAGYVNALPDAS